MVPLNVVTILAAVVIGGLATDRLPWDSDRHWLRWRRIGQRLS